MDVPENSYNSAVLERQKERNSIPLRRYIFTFFELLFYADPAWVDVVLIVVGTVTAITAGVPFPLMGVLFGELVDDMNGATCQIEESGNADSLKPGVNTKVLQLVYISIAAFVVVYAYLLCWSLVGQRLAQRLQEKYFASLLRQDIAFFDHRQAGEISSRISGDTQIIQSGTSEKVGLFISSISFLITAYTVGFIKYPKLAGMLVSLAPAFVLSSITCGRLVQKFSGRMSDNVAAASSIAAEALSNVPVVQAFSAEHRLESKFAGHMLKAKSDGVRKGISAATQAGLLYFITFSANALAFWQGTRAIAAVFEGTGDGPSVGAIYTVVFLIVDACTLLGQMAPLLPLFGSATAAFMKLRKDMNLRSAIDPITTEGQKLPPDVPASIDFIGVTFAYPSRPNQDVLRTVSFSCPSQKHTAIVGLSGSGKSTVAGLCLRLYDPKNGKVLFAGYDLRELNLRSLRSHISLVQQEPSLLDRSILENIALGLVNSAKPEHQALQVALLGSSLADLSADVRRGSTLVTAAQAYGATIVEIVKLVQYAADLADASSFINRLELGFGTKVGDSGKLVSGGQRQRVALARALIKDPSILILDEATASLDSASEKRIQCAIDSISRGRTVISIAHRLSTIKDADNIIVMSTGEIIEQGTHTELIAQNGSYARLVALQNVRAPDDDDARSSTLRGSLEIGSSRKTSFEKEPVRPILPMEEVKAEGKRATKDSATPGLDEKLSTLEIMRRIGRLMRPSLVWLVIAMSSAFLVGCTYAGWGVVFGNAVGAASPCTPGERIRSQGRLFAGLFFVLAVVEGLANLGSWSSFAYVAEKLLYAIRVQSFRSLLQQDLEWHQSKNRNPSLLLSIITKDSTAIGGFSGSIMGTLFAIGVNVVVAIVLSHIIAWKIAIVILAIFPVFLTAGVLQLRVLARFEKKHADAYVNAIGIQVGAINSIKTVAALSLEKEILGTYTRALRGPRKDITKATTFANLWLAIGFSTGNFLYAFAYWWGSKLIIKGEYTQTHFLIILMAMLVSAQLWGQVLILGPEVSKARSAALRMLNLLDIGTSNSSSPYPSLESPTLAQERDIEALADSKPKLTEVKGGLSVTFNSISFTYPSRPDIQVLDNISFTVHAKQFCGLVGPSGAGKSTIMYLIQRLYRPTTGTLEINGANIYDLHGANLRDNIAVVPQDSPLFDGSVKFNVGLGARSGQAATDEEIEEACRLANIHDYIISLPQGYDTECGPNGSRFSGGQRQRLAIARALVRKPQLLLLDESTSALDAESEKAIQLGLQRAAKDITVIVIAHRLHTVRNADVIFVVEGGMITAQGRHDELMEISESYRLNAMQQMLQN